MSEKRTAFNSDRPSRHGKVFGEALALLAEAGRKDSPTELPPLCATCAFRKGTVPNMTAATGLQAFNCALGIDKDRFACHHGMKDGDPQKLCVGYVAARLAPWSMTKQIVTALAKELDAVEADGDDVRAEFDKWLLSVDPNEELDVYQISRAFDRAAAKTRGA